VKEITIVTAFFNINRDGWEKFSRTADHYLQYFAGWARMKNKIIVYVENEELAAKVMDIRASFGLGDKTVVNLIPDYRDIDEELYAGIKKATTNPIQQQFRLLPRNPECWNYDYNYVMMMKMWCVQDAVARKQASGMTAWVDFGYNHGGAVIDRDSDFNFLWSYDFSEKINLFSIQNLDDRPVFDIVRSLDTYIMGTVIVGPDALWLEFWNLMRSTMMSLNHCGLTDDDQTVLLMAYRIRPELFKLHASQWMMQIKQFGGEHLRLLSGSNTRNKNLKEFLRSTVLYRVYLNFRDVCANFRYAAQIFRTLQKMKRH